jgi:hypothetical protein
MCQPNTPLQLFSQLDPFALGDPANSAENHSSAM